MRLRPLDYFLLLISFSSRDLSKSNASIQDTLDGSPLRTLIALSLMSFQVASFINESSMAELKKMSFASRHWLCLLLCHLSQVLASLIWPWWDALSHWPWMYHVCPLNSGPDCSLVLVLYPPLVRGHLQNWFMLWLTSRVQLSIYPLLS